MALSYAWDNIGYSNTLTDLAISYQITISIVAKLNLQPRNTNLALTRMLIAQTDSSVRWYIDGVRASSATPAW